MVVDASVVVDGLLDPTSVGDHARAAMGQSGVFVPDPLYPEASNALRTEEVRKQPRETGQCYRCWLGHRRPGAERIFRARPQEAAVTPARRDRCPCRCGTPCE